MIVQFLVNGSVIDTITTSSPSWSTTTILMGEGQGDNGSQPASTWWFDEVSFVQPTGAADAYSVGDRVTFEGKVYESTIDANVWSPTGYPAGWRKV